MTSLRKSGNPPSRAAAHDLPIPLLTADDDADDPDMAREAMAELRPRNELLIRNLDRYRLQLVELPAARRES